MGLGKIPSFPVSGEGKEGVQILDLGGTPEKYPGEKTWNMLTIIAYWKVRFSYTDSIGYRTRVTAYGGLATFTFFPTNFKSTFSIFLRSSPFSQTQGRPIQGNSFRKNVRGILKNSIHDVIIIEKIVTCFMSLRRAPLFVDDVIIEEIATKRMSGGLGKISLMSYSGKFLRPRVTIGNSRVHPLPLRTYCGNNEENMWEYEENMENMKEIWRNMKKYVVLGTKRAKHRAKRGASRHIFLSLYKKALGHGEIPSSPPYKFRSSI